MIVHAFPRTLGDTMRKAVLPAAVIVLLTVGIRVPLLSIPLERDEGEYAYIGWRLGHNELPYRDWVDQKPPAIFWVYRFALKLPLEPVRAVHCMGMLFSLGSAAALYLLARRFTDRFWATAVSGLFAILSADPLVQGTAANTEVFMLLPLILSQLAFLRATTGKARGDVVFMLLCGVLTGAAAAFKQVAAVNAVFLVAIYPVFVGAEKRWQSTARFAGWMSAGIAMVWGAVALYFFLGHGLSELLENVFTQNLEYINAVPWSTRAGYCAKTLASLSRSQTLVWLLAAVGYAAFWREGRRWFLFLAGWMITSLVGVSASGYFFPHYFQQALPALCIAACAGGEALSRARFWGGRPGWWRKPASVLVLLILPASAIGPFVFVYTPAEAVRRIYPGNLFAEMPELAGRIAQASSPEERVFIFGADPELLFYARRVSATRYIFLFPLYGPYRHAREKQVATAEEIARTKPAVAVYLPNRLFFRPGSEQFFTEWTRTYLKEQFRAEAYLTMDSAGAGHVIPFADGQEPQLSPGERRVGEFHRRARK